MVRRQLTAADEQRTWRRVEIERRAAAHQAALEKQKLGDALAMLSRSALYVVERLESAPPPDEGRALLGALRDSAKAAARVADDLAQAGCDRGRR